MVIEIFVFKHFLKKKTLVNPMFTMVICGNVIQIQFFVSFTKVTRSMTIAS